VESQSEAEGVFNDPRSRAGHQGCGRTLRWTSTSISLPLPRPFRDTAPHPAAAGSRDMPSCRKPQSLDGYGCHFRLLLTYRFMKCDPVGVTRPPLPKVLDLLAALLAEHAKLLRSAIASSPIGVDRALRLDADQLVLAEAGSLTHDHDCIFRELTRSRPTTAWSGTLLRHYSSRRGSWIEWKGICSGLVETVRVKCRRNRSRSQLHGSCP
jgi:hypothetical protein